MSAIAFTLGALPIILIGIFFEIFWIITLIDVAGRKFKEGSDKVVWVIIVIFANIIGSLTYYFTILKKDKPLKWFWIMILVLFIIWLVSIISSIIIGMVRWG